MRRALLVLFFLVPLTAPTADAQNICVNAQWEDLGEVGTVVRPEVDTYRGRITFTNRSGCQVPTNCPDASSSEGTFEILNQQMPWLHANFTANPVPINGSQGTLSSRSIANEIFFTLDRTAPFERSFAVQVRVRCEDNGVATTSRSFRVGPLVDVTADVIGAATIEGGAQWIVRITNSGNVPILAEFVPSPRYEDGIVWDVPQVQLVPVAEGDAGSIAVAVPISVTGERLPANMSVIVRMREADSDRAAPFEVTLPLPYTVFSGDSTPGFVVPFAFFALVLVALRRRFR